MDDRRASADLASGAGLALGVDAASLELSLVYQGPLADSTRVFAVRSRGRRPSAALLWSPPAAPDIVRDAMLRAERVAAALPSALAARVLRPLMQGRVQGGSYAVLPFCYRLSGFRPLWLLQRHLLRGVLADWLAGALEATARTPTAAERDTAFIAPLRQLAAAQGPSDRVRASAASALDRLESGHWQPRHALMHGDLWRGNVMVRAPLRETPQRWEQRVVLIDWLGARVDDGYPLFDLVRMMGDLRFGRSAARRELERHRALLGCEAQDLSSHLCAGLAHVHANLGEFPLARFAAMAEACLDTLARSLHEPGR